MLIALKGALSVQQIIENVGPALPAAGGLRGRPAARLGGCLILVPRTQDGTDEGEQLLHIVVELTRQAHNTSSRLTPGLLRRPLVTGTSLRHERLPEVNRLVPATATVEAMRRHGGLSAAALELRVLRKT